MTNGISEVIISNLAEEMNNNNGGRGKVFKCMYIHLTQYTSSVRRESVTGLSFLRNDNIIPCWSSFSSCLCCLQSLLCSPDEVFCLSGFTHIISSAEEWSEAFKTNSSGSGKAENTLQPGQWTSHSYCSFGFAEGLSAIVSTTLFSPWSISSFCCRWKKSICLTQRLSKHSL